MEVLACACALGWLDDAALTLRDLRATRPMLPTESAELRGLQQAIQVAHNTAHLAVRSSAPEALVLLHQAALVVGQAADRLRTARWSAPGLPSLRRAHLGAQLATSDLLAAAEALYGRM